MKKVSECQDVTPESVSTAFRKTERKTKKSRSNFDGGLRKARAEYKKFRIENKKAIDECDRQIKESRIEYEKYREENEKSRKDYERHMKKFEQTMGAWYYNNGEFAEEYFFNSFEDGQQTFFGEKFDSIDRKIKPLSPVMKDEYDIVLLNGKSVGIIEVKFKAHINDIPKVIRKAESLRVNFPSHANHQIYLGLASMTFYPELEQECINQGIAVIKQVGETVVINDTNLKVF